MKKLREVNWSQVYFSDPAQEEKWSETREHTTVLWKCERCGVVIADAKQYPYDKQEKSMKTGNCPACDEEDKVEADYDAGLIASEQYRRRMNVVKIMRDDMRRDFKNSNW